MRQWLSALACKFGRCLACRPYFTDDGCGGQCTRCGTIHGWVTREELMAYTERAHPWLR